MTSAAAEVVGLAESVELFLDPWQQFVVENALGERADRKWAAFEVGLIVPRQNGKGSILEARELGGLFLLNERLILHSAHEFKTAQEAFRRVLSLVENFDHLRKKVARIRTSHGEEGIELLNGNRLRFVARSGGSGRGFSGDCVILDEAMILGPKQMAALLPTLSSRPNPQLWYTASAGFDESEQLRRVRERGTAGGDPGLAYFEWSAEEDADLDDREAWAESNPALGIRIPEEFIERERAAMPDEEFGRERLSIWSVGSRNAVIDVRKWAVLEDRESKPGDPVAFAVDVNPERTHAAISVAGRRPDGFAHVEVVEYRKGTKWVPARLRELVDKWGGKYGLDPSGPAGSLLNALADEGLHDPELVAGREMAQACGSFYDKVEDGDLRHMGQPMLNTAVDAARRRVSGDSWTWHRRDTLSDICPLVAATVAVHLLGEPQEGSPAVWDWPDDL